jgi:hypothetical protein
MPIQDTANKILDTFNGLFIAKMFMVLFIVFYTIFAFILLRQVQIMTIKLPTKLSPVLKFVAIIHVGFALAILFLFMSSF